MSDLQGVNSMISRTSGKASPRSSSLFRLLFIVAETALGAVMVAVSSLREFNMKKGLAMVLIVISIMAPTSASASTRPAVDSSDAVRYNSDGSPIGSIVYEFVNRDDGTKKVDAPFPINFFGQKFPAICLSTNGLIYPIVSTSSNCSPSYDRSLEVLTLRSQASSIAALALDLNNASSGSANTERRLQNPHRESVGELRIENISATSTELSVTTTEPHGYLISDRVSLDLATVNFLFTEAGCSFPTEALVTGIVSDRSFTVSRSGCTPGTYSPAANGRAAVLRYTAMRQVSDMSLSGTTLTITSSSHTFGVGRKFTLTGTGITSLDQAELTVASRIDAANFTATVPAGVTDLDPVQAGNQSTVTFASDQPWALERDDNGAIQQVYFGSTTIDGRDAYAITWYRIPTTEFSGSNSHVNGTLQNPRTLSNTVQLVIIKGTTGSDANGWDYIYEFNIGHANDLSDGYSSTNPATQCTLSNVSDCRWAMGTAQYFEGPAISSITYAAPNITIDTVTSHGRSVGDYVIATNLCNDLGFLCDKPLVVSSVLDSDSLVLADPDAQAQDNFSSTSFSGAKLGYAMAYELFPSFSPLQLGDSGGTTALIRNSLNSSVAGRYTFAMSAGQVTNFRAPAMDSVIPAATTTPATSTPATSTPATSTPATLAATGTSVSAWAPALALFLGWMLVAYSRRLRTSRARDI